MNDHAPMLEHAFSSVPEETSYLINRIEGRVPDFISGTYYLAGPARFRRGTLDYRHWLDGDGMVCALHFGKEGVRVTHRFVHSEKWTAEEVAGKALFRAFGTAFPGDRLKRGLALEPPVNVSAYVYAGQLLAFGEQGLPWSLDPVTLETLGKWNFGRQLNDISPFSAHPKIDPKTGELFNFGVSFSSTAPSWTMYRFDETGKQTLRRRHPLDYPCSVHDFGLAPRYLCCYLSPYLLDMKRLAREGASLMDSLDWRPGLGSRMLIVDRASGEKCVSLPIGDRYCLHFINAYEEGSKLVIDVLELDEPVYSHYQPIPNLFEQVKPGRPVRFIVDVDDWHLAERREGDYDLAPDFATTDPRKHQHRYHDFWMLGIAATGKPGRKFFDQLAHCRWDQPETRDIYQAPPYHYLGGEPIFIPDPASERGVIICQEFDARTETGYFALFDPEKVADGPLARLVLEVPLPLMFHASFHGETT